MTLTQFDRFIKETIKAAIKEEKEVIKSLVPDQDSQDYCTIPKAAEKFNVSCATIHNWSKAGRIKKYKIGGRTLFKIDELNRAMTANQIQNPLIKAL